MCKGDTFTLAGHVDSAGVDTCLVNVYIDLSLLTCGLGFYLESIYFVVCF